MSQLLSVIDEKVPLELTIVAVSLWLIVFLSLTSVVYLLVFIGKENRFGWPLRGIIWFTVAIIGFCVVIGFLAGSEQTARSLRESLQTLTAINAKEPSGGVATTSTTASEAISRK